MTTTMTETIVGDLTYTKTETFDIDFANDILKQDISEEDRQQLRRYIKNRVRGNQVDVGYKLGKDIKSEGLGRLVAIKGIGLQNMSRDIRAALARKYYFDVDIVNAVFTIMSQYAKKRGLAVPQIERYIQQREEILETTASSLNITRDEAKKKIAALMNSASFEGMTPWIVNELGPEIRTLIRNVWKLNESDLKFLNKVPNATGKGMAYIYQTEERKVLLALDNALSRRGRSLDTYIHDGGLVRRKEFENELSTALLRDCEADIERDTGYKISLIVKPLITSFIRTQENANDDYAMKKRLWEETGWKGDTFFKVRHPPVFIAMSSTGWEQMTRSDLIQNEEDNLLSDGSPFVRKWLEDPEKKEYNRLVFLPGKEAEPGDFNLFRGFKFPAIPGDWSLMRDLLMLLVDDDEKAYEWVENWIASILQKPYEKTQVCVISQGHKGCGKDTFWNLVGRMFGEYFYNTSTPEYNVFSKFNSAMARVIFLKFEEANFQTNKTNDDALKALITSETNNIEKKGQDPVALNNYTNCVMSTNHENPILIGDDERRFMLIKASDKRIGDTAFWNATYKQIEEEGDKILSAYLYYLTHKDIRGWCPRPAYKTQYYRDVASSSIPYHARFFQKCIELNEGMGEVKWNSATLLRELQNANPKFEITAVRLGIILRDHYIAHQSMTKLRKSIGYEYVMDCAAAKQLLINKGWWIDY